jgi:hypothetical protein
MRPKDLDILRYTRGRVDLSTGTHSPEAGIGLVRATARQEEVQRESPRKSLGSDGQDRGWEAYLPGREDGRDI